MIHNESKSMNHTLFSDDSYGQLYFLTFFAQLFETWINGTGSKFLKIDILSMTRVCHVTTQSHMVDPRTLFLDSIRLTESDEMSNFGSFDPNPWFDLGWLRSKICMTHMPMMNTKHGFCKTCRHESWWSNEINGTSNINSWRTFTGGKKRQKWSRSK